MERVPLPPLDARQYLLSLLNQLDNPDYDQQLIAATEWVLQHVPLTTVSLPASRKFPRQTASLVASCWLLWPALCHAFLG